MSTFIEQLGWVLVHSLWQFALLAAGAFVLQRALRRTSASARYVVLLAMLGIVVAAPFATWGMLPVEAPQPVIAAVEPPAQPKPVALPKVAPAPVAVEVVPLPALAAPAPIEPVAVSPPVASAPLPELPRPTWSERIQEAVTPWLSTIVWGWSLGVLAFALRPLLGWFTVHRLRTRGVSPVPEAVQAALAATAQRLGITHAVRVLQSAVVQVPIVAGYFQPVILLPVSIVTGMPASQLEAILAHELAHIRRHDYLVNLVQTLIETIFFYHPAVWWLSHQIRCERENCCDDIAVSALGSRLDYSRALLALEELRAVQTPLAVGANGGSLLERVRRLFHREPAQSSLSNGSVILCGTLIVGLLALAAMAGARGELNDEDAIPGAKIEIPGKGTLEITGLLNEDLKWWSPDGSKVDNNFDPGTAELDFDFEEDSFHGRKIGLLLRFSGIEPLQWSRINLKAPRTGSFAGWSGAEPRQSAVQQVTDIRFQTTNLTPSANTGDSTVLLSFDLWRDWQTIDLKAPELSQNEGPLVHLVGSTPRDLAPKQCEIGLKFKDGAHQEIHYEQIAIDVAGNEIQPAGYVGNHELGLTSYSVPESQVVKLKYRVQWYTHEVRFRNLSLKPGHTTEPQVSVKVLKFPQRNHVDFSSPTADATSWPQLGGSASHNSVSTVTNLPTQFDLAKQENIRWSQPIGNLAFSSPVV